jgi:hypothetical protein
MDPDESLLDEFIQKCLKTIPDISRHVLSMVADLLNHVIEGLFPVKKLPHVHAGGAQAETTTGIGVEENGPVVKLLSEHDERVGNGFFTVFHGMTSPLAMAPQRAVPIRGHTAASCNLSAGDGRVFYHYENIVCQALFPIDSTATMKK